MEEQAKKEGKKTGQVNPVLHGFIVITQLQNVLAPGIIENIRIIPAWAHFIKCAHGEKRG
jgi:hypothetical protein